MTSLSYTENYGIQFEATGNPHLDLFSQIGAMRHFALNNNPQPIRSLFHSAFLADKELAVKIAFWTRWCRGGSGERATFHVILKELTQLEPDFVKDNIDAIVEYGYWKDLVPYSDPDKYPYIAEQIERKWAIGCLQKDRLACKWAPRKGDLARAIKGRMNFTWKEYRVWLKENSETVEQGMAMKEWDKITYPVVPSISMTRHHKAFMKWDKERFEAFIADKDAKVNASVLYPYQIIRELDSNEALAEKLWAHLPDYLVEGESILPMVDVSGSMTMGQNPVPIEVAISLGMYLSERAFGPFRNKMLTFSQSPEFFTMEKDWSLKERASRIAHANWDMNTDFEKAYRMILEMATAFKLSQDKLPSMLLVLSDMQFDESQRGSNKPHLEEMEISFKEAGYKLPKLVFWNLNAYNNGAPAVADKDGVCMVSGFSPAIMKAILKAEDFNPVDIMMEAIEPIELDFKSLVKN